MGGFAPRTGEQPTPDFQTAEVEVGCLMRETATATGWGGKERWRRFLGLGGVAGRRTRQLGEAGTTEPDQTPIAPNALDQPEGRGRAAATVASC